LVNSVSNTGFTDTGFSGILDSNTDTGKKIGGITTGIVLERIKWALLTKITTFRKKYYLLWLLF
jgi:hypothetical protein